MLPADADFLAFKEQLEKGPEPLPSAEAQLERQEAEARERQAAGEHDGSRESCVSQIVQAAGEHQGSRGCCVSQILQTAREWYSRLTGRQPQADMRDSKTLLLLRSSPGEEAEGRGAGQES